MSEIVIFLTILKIIGIVLLALILLIFILTLFSINVYLSFDKKGVRLTVKYLGIKVFNLDTSEKKTDRPSEELKPPEEPKPEPEPESKKPEPEFEITEITEIPEVSKEPEAEPNPEPQEPPKPEESVQEELEKEQKGSSLMDKWNVLKQYLPKVKTALKKLLKLIKIRGLDLHLTVGSDDAATAGQNFGKINAVFYNALALICCLFSVTIKKTEIKCDYEHKAFEAEGSLHVKAKVLSILALAVYILTIYIKAKSALDNLDKPESESNSRKKDHNERKEK
ncbi:MAG: hypothetical protein LUC38_08565 [Oscillospiraceae bacterium]|nr:hypothetical protein [Oscillospiraceae bacterium]